MHRMAASSHHQRSSISVRLLLLALLLAVSTAFLPAFKQPARPQRAAVAPAVVGSLGSRAAAMGMRPASAVGGGVNAGAGAAAK